MPLFTIKNKITLELWYVDNVQLSDFSRESASRSRTLSGVGIDKNFPPFSYVICVQLLSTLDSRAVLLQQWTRF